MKHFCPNFNVFLLLHGEVEGSISKPYKGRDFLINLPFNIE